MLWKVVLLVWTGLLLFGAIDLRASGTLGEFSDLKLVIDADPAEGNDGIKTLPIPVVGQTISVQFFVPSAAGKQTIGYTINFGMALDTGAGRLLGDIVGEVNNYVVLQSGESWDGTSIPIRGDNPRELTGLFIGKPTVPASGFLGTATLLVQAQLSPQNVITVSGTMADAITGDSDVLNSSGAIIRFIRSIEPIPGDIDLDGDVDFSDFLIFANNFGKSGPVPTTPGGTCQ